MQFLSLDSRQNSQKRFQLTHHHHHQSFNCKGRWGTTDDFATSFLHFCMFSTALWDFANSRLVHSLISSSLLFVCLPCLLPPFTVPCKMVLARPDERETCPYLDDGQEISVWSDCLLDLGMDFLVGGPCQDLARHNYKTVLLRLFRHNR